MSYYIGVDGGTTRMEAVVLDESGVERGRGRSGPIYAGAGNDHPQAGEHLRACIGGALAAASVSLSDVAGTCLTLSNWNESRLPEARAFLAPLGLGGTLLVMEDGPGAWAAAGYPDPCIFVLLGTFSGVGGFQNGGYVVYPLNDWDLDFDSAVHGEGYVIGSTALGEALVADTALTQALCEHLGVTGRSGLFAWARTHEAKRERAALCRVAAEVAAAGDEVALAIFRRAGEGTARAVTKCAGWMDVAAPTVVLAGNVWQAGALVREPFAAALAVALPGTRIVGPVDQAYGAALLVRDEMRRRAAEHAAVYETHDLPAFTFSEVAPGVLAGRNPLTALDVEQLASQGVTHLIDLRERHEWTAPRFGEAALAEVQRLCLTRHHVVVPDLGPPSPAALDQACSLLDSLLADPASRVYLHCRAGMERTGAVLCAWYARTHGVSYDQALAALRVRRPILAPLPTQERAVRGWLAR